ncbi:RNA polymerase factor sigma-54 [Alterisphingorhabdus coralli]|uniref:RNA polymerase sigma-54 factor n=1 Tax=Alterisphingorhabdus coralli TaxID=3071408 RepID=A0AA97F9W3_9SPHN|nr:RNA polymerase factor sigma-54 [Parasphingorhabdus sp. SCSIO 66989]WOE75175.1 RNA polymerase factor sigma-54 [Parasphingorhabdus sp. SCSIO 66989]
MALGPRLDLRQKQSLVMTPQMQQAVKLLALSNLEMEGYLNEALEKNPLLESEGTSEKSPSSEDASEGDATISDSAENGAADAGFEDAPAPDGADTLIAAGAGEADAPLDSNSDTDVFHHDSAADMMGSAALGASAVSGGGGEEGPDWENMLAESISLHDHLRAQVAAVLNGEDMLIADQIIGHIDDSGYLKADTLALAHQLGVSVDHLEDVLAVVQQSDPSGVGARSLSECIAIQAREADRYDPAMARLIDNLDLVARRDIARLKRLCRVDEEDIIDMISELRDYDPRPGAAFAGSAAAPVVPDVFVRPKPGGAGWHIEMNPATLPRLLINRRYHSELSEGLQDKASKAWLNECLNDASWLIRTLDQRQRTITKVATEIVKRQEGFFREGVAHLKPLTLRQVADAIEMHESTISRVTSNKYLNCDRGTFELKYFFTTAIQSADGGEAVSSSAVKDALKTLIDNEDPKKILSDDKLVAMLKDQGYDIARRTVAKYREAMNLGSSVQRRREKAMLVK